MCGIFGYVGPELPDRELLVAAARAGQRGPHAHGWYADGALHRAAGPLTPDTVPTARVLLGHARLATYGRPDDPAGIQPITAGGHTVVHNGNVNNWRELCQAGAPSDTWAIAQQYAEARAEASPVRALTVTLGQLDHDAHVLVILDAGGALIASRRHLPLHVARRGAGLYLSSLPFADAAPVPEAVCHLTDIPEKVSVDA